MVMSCRLQGCLRRSAYLLLCTWFILPSISLLAVQPGVAGDYDRVILAEQAGYVTGLFSDCTGECKFSCQFFFEGERRSDRFAIVAHEPGSGEWIRGEATLHAGKLKLKLASSPGGCWNVEPEISKAGAEFLLNAAAPWLQIRLVQSNAALYDKPGGKKLWRLQQNAPVIVLRHESGWLHVRLPAGDARTGWVRKTDLQLLRQQNNHRK